MTAIYFIVGTVYLLSLIVGLVAPTYYTYIKDMLLSLSYFVFGIIIVFGDGF
uniref:Uncharacterized protein n=1 Tax=Candidatus Kentrum sp. DK TaxID=2126562 RepID=A0A450SYQ7_9GAMM|nr:MAG: hypothetical protein BECKDK2373C_GA0170839_107119 [Candidatus Kentron sp. DK]